MRTPGGLIDAFYTSLGISGVAMPATEIAMALQKGVIDGVVANYQTFQDQSIWEGAKYGLIGDYAWVDGTIAFNLGVWNKLPKDIQAILEQATRDVEKHMAEYWPQTRKMSEDKLAKVGVTFTYLTPGDKATSAQLLAKVAQTWVEKNGAPGKKIAEFRQTLG